MTQRKQFFIIGAQRSGTTYLYKALNKHPEISMATPLWPEPKYFASKNFSCDTEYYEQKFYPENTSMFGEKSTCYYELPNVPERIQSAYPSAKFILIIRNPTLRALSNYRFSFVNGLETRTCDEVFLKKTPQPDFDTSKISVNPFEYIQRGIYLPFIKHYLNFFPREAMHIVVFERLVKSPTTVDDIFEFLEVDGEIAPAKQYPKTNGSCIECTATQEIKRQLHQHFQEDNDKLRDFLGDLLPEWDVTYD